MTDDETRIVLIAAAMVKHGFRAPGRFEDPAKYFEALFHFVDARNYADGHELLLGRRRADWTPADAQSFMDRLERKRVRNNAHNPEAFDGPREFAIAEDAGPFPVTDDELRRMADVSLKMLEDRRTAAPAESLPIMVTGLLTNGHLLHSQVDRDDRIAFVKLLAQTRPLYGYVLVADMLMHAVNAETGTTSTVDGIVVHVGSRTLRLMKVHTYRVAEGAVVWDAPREDLDLHAMRPGDKFEDPYAGIFVSVPPPTGAPS